MYELPNTEEHIAIVLGLSPNGLGIVRSLAAHQLPIIGVDRRPAGMGDAHRWMSSKTRMCQKHFYDGTAEDDLLTCLLELGKQLSRPGILFPSGDSELLCISQNRKVLSEYYRFCIPENQLVELLADKARFYALADNLGIAIPNTFVNPSPDTINDIARQIGYPCLIKPNLRGDLWARHFPGVKALTAKDAGALATLFETVWALDSEFIVQEIVPGPDTNLHFSNIFLNEDLIPLALWTGRKIRQRPIHFGTSTLTETLWNEDIAKSTVSILQELKCRGYSSIEFKKDSRDGEYRIMEITQGRTWYPHYLGFGAGVNIPHIWYLDLIGKGERSTHKPADGIRWIDEYRDLTAAFQYWRCGELTIADWIRSLRNVKVFSYASWKDPLPLMFVFARFLIAAPRRLYRIVIRR